MPKIRGKGKGKKEDDKKLKKEEQPMEEEGDDVKTKSKKMSKGKEKVKDAEEEEKMDKKDVTSPENKVKPPVEISDKVIAPDPKKDMTKEEKQIVDPEKAAELAKQAKSPDTEQKPEASVPVGRGSMLMPFIKGAMPPHPFTMVSSPKEKFIHFVAKPEWMIKFSSISDTIPNIVEHFMKWFNHFDMILVGQPNYEPSLTTGRLMPTDDLIGIRERAEKSTRLLMRTTSYAAIDRQLAAEVQLSNTGPMWQPVLGANETVGGHDLTLLGMRGVMRLHHSISEYNYKQYIRPVNYLEDDYVSLLNSESGYVPTRMFNEPLINRYPYPFVQPGQYQAFARTSVTIAKDLWNHKFKMVSESLKINTVSDGVTVNALLNITEATEGRHDAANEVVGEISAGAGLALVRQLLVIKPNTSDFVGEIFIDPSPISSSVTLMGCICAKLLFCRNELTLESRRRINNYIEAHFLRSITRMAGQAAFGNFGTGSDLNYPSSMLDTLVGIFNLGVVGRINYQDFARPLIGLLATWADGTPPVADGEYTPQNLGSPIILNNIGGALAVIHSLTLPPGAQRFHTRGNQVYHYFISSHLVNQPAGAFPAVYYDFQGVLANNNWDKYAYLFQISRLLPSIPFTYSAGRRFRGVVEKLFAFIGGLRDHFNGYATHFGRVVHQLCLVPIANQLGHQTISRYYRHKVDINIGAVLSAAITVDFSKARIDMDVPSMIQDGLGLLTDLDRFVSMYSYVRNTIVPDLVANKPIYTEYVRGEELSKLALKLSMVKHPLLISYINNFEKWGSRLTSTLDMIAPSNFYTLKLNSIYNLWSTFFKQGYFGVFDKFKYRPVNYGYPVANGGITRITLINDPNEEQSIDITDFVRNVRAGMAISRNVEAAIPAGQAITGMYYMLDQGPITTYDLQALVATIEQRKTLTLHYKYEFDDDESRVSTIGESEARALIAVRKGRGGNVPVFIGPLYIIELQGLVNSPALLGNVRVYTDFTIDFSVIRAPLE
jgi:hypothetical protein